MIMKFNFSKNAKKLALLGLILLATVSVGYALLSQTINIITTATLSGTWDVQVTEVTYVSTWGREVVGEPTISHDNKNVTINVEFSKPGGQAFFNMKVKNNGTINAEMKTINVLFNGSLDPDPDIRYYILEGAYDAVPSNIDAGQEIIYTIKVFWQSSDTEAPEPKTITIDTTLSIDPA